jgi:hypothetical protein
MVHEEGGLLEDTRCPVPSVGPTLTDRVFAGSVPGAKHGPSVGPAVGHAGPPTG